MGWTAINPCVIGAATKKVHYDTVFDNAAWIYAFVNSCNLTDHGVLIGSGIGAITASAVGTNGQIVVGQTAADPLWKTLGGDIAAITAAGVVTIANRAINRVKLKTTSAEVAVWVAGGGTDYTPIFTGGEYTFTGYVKASVINRITFLRFGSNGFLGVAYVAYSAVFSNTAGDAQVGYHLEYYVQASGEVFWIMILRNKITKEIYKTSMGSDHPCVGSGGDPVRVPHPFGDYDTDKYEIVVINPTKEEVLTIKKRGEKTGKLFTQTVVEEYEIDEESISEWPTEKVTVKLPPDWDEAWLSQTPVTPIRKQIPKPDYVLCRNLKKKL